MIPKYQYHLLTWGGFYNDQHKRCHGFEEGDYFFDSLEEREGYIAVLRVYVEILNARELMITRTEGYSCGIRTVLHRVVEYEGIRYYSEYDMGVNYPFSAAKYHMKYKWQPGFNDYPLGEEHDYEGSPPTIIQEWVTGADNEVELDY